MIRRCIRLWFPDGALGQTQVLSMMRIIIGLSLVMFISFALCIRFVEQKNKADNTILQAQNTLSLMDRALVDQETGQRGYDLSGNPVFLAPYQSGTVNFNNEAVKIQTELVSYPNAERLVKQLIQQGDEWHRRFGAVQITDKQLGQTVSVSALLSGKKTLDQFRNMSYHLQQHLQKEENRTEQQFDTDIRWLLFGVIGFIICISILSVIVIGRQFSTMVAPLHVVSRAVQKYGNHSFEEPLTILSNAPIELQMLMRNIESMRKQLNLSHRLDRWMYSFSLELQNSLNYEKICEISIRGVSEIVDADFASLVMHEGRNKYRVIYRLVNHQLEKPNRILQDAQTNILSMLPLHRILVYSNWEVERPQGINNDMFFQIGVRSSVHIPIENEGETLAIIHLGSTNKYHFDEDALLTLERITPMMGFAIRNARTYREVELLSLHDGLTGLWNRRYLELAIPQAMQDAKDSGTTLFMVMADIDHFKQFNDTYGHLEGDRLLKHVATVLKSSLRMEDMVARYGGEEFVVLLPDLTLETARQTIERVRRQLMEQRLAEYLVTVSFGVVMWCAGEAKETLMQRADDALYRAKEEGRNRVIFS